MRNLSIGLSAIALMAVSAAHAQSPVAPPAPPAPQAGARAMPPRAMPPMKDMSRAEAQARAEKMFDKMDINHDGKLDKADREAREAKHFDAMDTNHDGQLSRQEFMAAHDAMREGMKQRMGRGHDMPPPPPGGPEGGMAPDGMGMKGPRDHQGMGRQGMGHHHMERGMMMGLMRQADPNHTGTVTKDAFVGAALKMFDSADANHDGVVTPEERRAAMKAQMGAWQERGRRGPGQHRGHDMPPPPPPAGQ